MEHRIAPPKRSLRPGGGLFGSAAPLADGGGGTILVQDVRFYSKTALHDRLKAWRAGGAASDGAFDPAGAMEPDVTTRPTADTHDGKPLTNMAGIVETRIFNPNVFGLQ